MPRATLEFTSRFAQTRAAIDEAQARAVAQVGKAISANARSRMRPGYFYVTGASRRRTRYRQLTPTTGAVRITTPYASFVEYGTVHSAARPVLRPAVAAVWPQMAQTAQLACSAMEGTHLVQTLAPIPTPGTDEMAEETPVL